MFDVTKNTFLSIFKGICMNLLLELKFFILSHSVTSKQPPEIVQIHMHHPVVRIFRLISKIWTSGIAILRQNKCFSSMYCLEIIFITLKWPF